MAKQLTHWDESEKDTLALYIIESLSKKGTISKGIKEFLSDNNKNNRTEQTCAWMWGQIKGRYTKEMEELGIKLRGSRKTSQDVQQPIVIEKPSEESLYESPETSTLLNVQSMEDFLETFDKAIQCVKTIYNENVALRIERDKLMGMVKVRDEALDQAKEQLETFVRAFQLARPNAIQGIIPVHDFRATVNGKGEVTSINIQNDEESVG